MLFLISDRGVPSEAKFVQVARGGCLDAPVRTVGTRLGSAKLGRARTRQRRINTEGRLIPKRAVDRWCLVGGGTLRVGYPTARLSHALRASTRRRISGRVVIALTTSQRFSIHGLRQGARSRTVARRLRGARRYKIGRNTWFVARGRGARLLVRSAADGSANSGSLTRKSQAQRARPRASSPRGSATSGSTRTLTARRKGLAPTRSPRLHRTGLSPITAKRWSLERRSLQ